MKYYPEQDHKVAEFLASIGVQYNAVHIAAMQHDPEWQHDLFHINFTRTGGKVLTTEFKTGIGHRLTANGNGFSSGLTGKDQSKLKELQAILKLTGHSGTVKKELDLNRGRFYAVLPTQASVIYSLLSDTYCVEYSSFTDFCDNLGYNSDSIKAFEVFNACCKISKDLKQFFTSQNLETLQQLLQDY